MNKIICDTCGKEGRWHLETCGNCLDIKRRRELSKSPYPRFTFVRSKKEGDINV